MKNHMHNTRIKSITPLPSPSQIKADLPMTEKSWATIKASRELIPKILWGDDRRFLVVMGPCSIHNEREALEYARRLVDLNCGYGDRLHLVMRVCCGKPRSRKSWLGFFNDWDMSGNCDILEGWRRARRLMLDITALGVPIGMEFLDAHDHQNVDDLPSYAWIGARNAQTQDYRIVASGLSVACGFKNPTVGSVKPAVESIEFARHSSVFASPDDHGVRSRFETAGNPDCHLILRGTDEGPNYDEDSVAASGAMLRRHDLNGRVIVDASHGNSRRNHLEQETAIHDAVRQIKADKSAGRVPAIAGIMYESYLDDGNQPIQIPVDRAKLRPGVSVTDGCDGLLRTRKVIGELYAGLA